MNCISPPLSSDLVISDDHPVGPCPFVLLWLFGCWCRRDVPWTRPIPKLDHISSPYAIFVRPLYGPCASMLPLCSSMQPSCVLYGSYMRLCALYVSTMQLLCTLYSYHMRLRSRDAPTMRLLPASAGSGVDAMGLLRCNRQPWDKHSAVTCKTAFKPPPPPGLVPTPPRPAPCKCPRSTSTSLKRQGIQRLYFMLINQLNATSPHHPPVLDRKPNLIEKYHCVPAFVHRVMCKQVVFSAFPLTSTR